MDYKIVFPTNILDKVSNKLSRENGHGRLVD